MNTASPPPSQPDQPAQRCDVFISHASEDKESFVRPLAAELKRLGLTVWYDETTLKIGDTLSSKIDEGLTSARFGIVILSPAFFAKNWPKKELGGLLAREVQGHKVILPVRHGLSHEDLVKHSPMLADKLAASSADGVEAVARQILDAAQPHAPKPSGATPLLSGNRTNLTIPAEDIAFYRHLIETTVSSCLLRRWGDFAHGLSMSPPEWDSNLVSQIYAFGITVRQTVWPTTLPQLDAAIKNLALCWETALAIFSQHIELRAGKHCGRAFYKDTGYNPNYDRDVKRYDAWIEEYQESLQSLAKSLNWFADELCQSTTKNN